MEEKRDRKFLGVIMISYDSGGICRRACTPPTEGADPRSGTGDPIGPGGERCSRPTVTKALTEYFLGLIGEEGGLRQRILNHNTFMEK